MDLSGEHCQWSYFLVKISLEEALSSIPPPVTYSPKCTTLKTTKKVNGDPPTSVMLWNDFLDVVNRFHFDQQQPRFERPKFNDRFVVINEEVLRNAMNVNVCMILNDLGLEITKLSLNLVKVSYTHHTFP